jgi:DNA-binding beta-propeller fold protein YncE
VAVGPDAVWVADSDTGTVTRVDPTGLTTPITVGGSPSAIALDAAASYGWRTEVTTPSFASIREPRP